MVPQLALAGALVLVAVAVLAFRNPQVIFNDVPSALKGISPQTTPAPTPQPFTCTDRSGGTTGASSQLKTIRTAPHDGYDRIVFEFSGQIPSYDLSRQDSATFVRDARGQPVTLDGSVGIKLVFRNTDATSGVPADARPALTSVKEIAQIGNFERVLSYGIGLASSQCVRVLELSGPARLVVDVATTASASTTAAPTPLPTLSPSGTDLGAFSCLDHTGGANTGSAMQLTAVRVAHQPGFDRIVFEFAPPAGAHSPPSRLHGVTTGLGEVRQGSERSAGYDARVVGSPHRLPRSERHQLRRQPRPDVHLARCAGSRAALRLPGRPELGRRPVPSILHPNPRAH